MGRIDAVSYGNNFDINRDKVVNERDVNKEFALKFAKFSRNERIQYIGYMSSGVRKALAGELYKIVNDPRRTDIPAGWGLVKNPGDSVFVEQEPEYGTGYDDNFHPIRIEIPVPSFFSESLLWQGPEADRTYANIMLAEQALKNLAAQSTEAVDYLADQVVKYKYYHDSVCADVVYILEYALKHGAPRQRVIRNLGRIVKLNIDESARGVLWNMGIRTYGEPEDGD